MMEKVTYKYNPSDYDEELCEYMTAFYMRRKTGSI